MADTQLGLTSEEASARLAREGPNEIEKTRRFSPFRLLLTQFASPLIYILLVAGVVSLALAHSVDAIIVFAAVAINVALGYYQEYKAERSLEALEKVITVDVEVLRDGERRTIAMREVVVGDIVFLKMGDKVPADGVVISQDYLTVSEAVLTGESVPVSKKAFDGSAKKLSDVADAWGETAGTHKVFMGTSVVTGLGQMIVVSVGQETQVGQIAERLRTTRREKTVLQQQLSRFAQFLTWIVVGASLVLFAVGVVRGESFADVFLVSVAVAVSAIPEGLVVALTAILAVGMQRILKRRGLVRKLLAAEALGSVTIVCADKTGTLTEGAMRVVSHEGSEGRLAFSSVYGNDLSDPLEVAMLDWGKATLRVSSRDGKTVWEREETLPFSPSVKYAASLVRSGRKHRLLVRGAPEVVLARCSLDRVRRKEWERRFSTLARGGYRLVGFAHVPIRSGSPHSPESIEDDSSGLKSVLGESRSVSGLQAIVDRGGLRWDGILVFEDPIRSSVKKHIRSLSEAGISFKVITGDFAETAVYVMEQLGVMVDGVVTGADFRAMKIREQRKAIAESVLFARFSPEDKLRVVELLQGKGEVVAMMGDGVNDAPALKKADVGVVVSSASEVSKETADMVLLDDNFGTVVEAVEEGRGIFANIRKVVLYLLSDSFSEVILVLGAMVLGMPLPLTAAQILWVNLANDSFPALALTLEPLEPGLMKRGPRSREASLVDGEMRVLMAIISGFTGLYVLVVFWFLLQAGYDLSHARTVAFLFLGLDSLMYVFVARSLERPLWRMPFFSNPWLHIGVAIGVAMQIAVLYNTSLQGWFGTHALGRFEWLVILVGVLFLLITIEFVKFLYRRKAEA